MVVGAEPAQGQVGLGGEDQRKESGAERDAAFHQPQRDRDRDDRHRERRNKFEDQRREERQSQRGQRPFAVGAGDRRDRALLGAGAAKDAQRRQTGDDIEELAAELLQREQLALHPFAGDETDQRHEGGHERDRHQQNRRREPVVEGDRDDDQGRHEDREHDLWQVEREVGVECIDPACR